MTEFSLRRRLQVWHTKMQITSTKNSRIQEIRRAVQAGRPTKHGLVIAEGPHLIEEARTGSWGIEQLLISPEARSRFPDLLDGIKAETLEVSSRIVAAIAGTEACQGVLGLLRPKPWTWYDLLSSPALLVVLDGTQDPGNAGTMVRSAEAFGATGLILLKGCARVANGKFLRATAGSIFRLPFREEVPLDEMRAQFRSAGLKLYGLSPQTGTNLSDIDWTAPCALAVGSEGRGLSPELTGEVHSVVIPTSKVESLNAAVACSIALFEASRQRASS